MTYNPTDTNDDGTVDADVDNTNTTTQTLDTEVLGDEIRFASSFTGANGREQIQNALDDLGTTAGTVIVDGAPDSLSSGPADQSNGWQIDQSIQVPSNTLLKFESAYLFLENGADDNIIRNKNADSGDATRDENIHIEGPAILDGNPSNQTRLSNQELNNGVHLYKVDRFSVSGITIGPTNAWGLVPEDVNQSGDDDSARISDVAFRQDDATRNQDGIHVGGPAQHLTCDTITGQFGDDAFAVESSGASTSLRGSGGEVRNVGCRGLTGYGAGASAALRVIAESGQSLNDVYLKDATYSTGSQVIKIGWNGVSNNPSASELRGITVDGLTVTDEQQPNNLVKFETEAQDVTVQDVTVHNSLSDIAIEVISTVSQLNNLTFKDLTTDGHNGTYFYNNAADVDGLEMHGITDTLTTNNKSLLLDNNLTDVSLQDINLSSDTDPATNSDRIAIRIRDTATVNGFLKLDGANLDTYGIGISVESGATLNAKPRFNGVTFDTVDVPWSINQGSPIQNGTAQQALGGTAPTDSNWEVGDVVEDTDNAGDAYQKLPSSGFTQIGT